MKKKGIQIISGAMKPKELDQIGIKNIKVFYFYLK